MSTSVLLISDISDEPSDIEGVVKIYETNEDTEEDPTGKDTVFGELPPHKQ